MTTWDQHVKGLHSITRNGKSSWYVYYRLRDGKQRRSKIGSTTVISLKQAREIAKEILAKVALGQDPFGDRKKKSVTTVHDVFTKLFLDHYSQERFARSGHRKDVLYLYEKHIEPTFGKKPIEKVTAPQILEWHRGFRKTPILGNRAKAVLSKICNFAESIGHLPPGSNPAGSVPGFRENVRKRYATEKEIEKIVEVLSFYALMKPRQAAFLKILLLTGSRINALERAKWVDLTSVGGGAILRVQGKTGIDEIVISKKALAVIEGLPRIDEYVFGKFPRALWKKVKQQVGAKGLWARDLRRTFGTVGLSNGISRGAISELLNHRSEQTTKIYSLLVPKAKMLAANAISEEIERAK